MIVRAVLAAVVVTTLGATQPVFAAAGGNSVGHSQGDAHKSGKFGRSGEHRRDGENKHHGRDAHQGDDDSGDPTGGID